MTKTGDVALRSGPPATDDSETPAITVKVSAPPAEDWQYCPTCAQFVRVQVTGGAPAVCPTCGAITEDRELPW